MTSTTVPSVATSRLPFTRVLLAGVIAIVLSVIANLVVRWLGMLVASVPADFVPLATFQPTIIYTTLFLVVATLIFALINRFTSNPIRVWYIVAPIGLLVSLLPDVLLLVNPSGIPQVGTATTGAVLILMAMHLVGFVITMWVFTRWAPRT